MSNKIPSQPGASPNQALSSVEHALRLLALLAERGAIRVADAASELGVARSSAHRLLATLTQCGFVRQEKPNGPYGPGPALSELGRLTLSQTDVRQVARPALEYLSSATQETVSLLLLHGNRVRFIDCLESPKTVRVATRTGVVLPAHCTAGGKALLARLRPDELARRYQSRRLETPTRNSIGSWNGLVRELEIVREDGFAVNIGEGELAVSAIGAVIEDSNGAAMAAVAIAAPTSRMKSREDWLSVAPTLVHGCGLPR
jgi:DNA-binding IclR family transcriptional regulator